MRKEERKCD